MQSPNQPTVTHPRAVHSLSSSYGSHQAVPCGLSHLQGSAAMPRQKVQASLSVVAVQHSKVQQPLRRPNQLGAVQHCKAEQLLLQALPAT